MASNRRLLTKFLGAVALLLVSPLLLSLVGCFPWSPINCWHYDVDIQSGRVRYTRYFAFLPLAQRIEESAVSQVLQPDDVRDARADWQRVHTFSPGVGTSPHYRFHSAVHQMRRLEQTWQLGEFTPAARRASAMCVLKLWQQQQSDNAADSYLQALGELALQRAAEHKGTEVQDLPAAGRAID